MLLVLLLESITIYGWFIEEAHHINNVHNGYDFYYSIQEMVKWELVSFSLYHILLYFFVDALQKDYINYKNDLCSTR